MTNIQGIFACGNCLHVHDLVDYVSNEGERADFFASKYINNTLTSDNVTLDIKPGIGINCVLPTTVNLNNIDDLMISFRESKPSYNSKLKILLNGQLIKKYNKSYMLPSEMESIKINKKDLKEGILALEVEYA